MNKFAFELINLTNDKPIAMLTQIKSEDIKLACFLYKIEPTTIGINIINLYKIKTETD